MISNSKQRVIIITTGGTIEKTYDESDGSLENRQSTVKEMILSHLRLPYTEIEVYSVLSKDSLYMTDEDRHLLLLSIKNHLTHKTPIVVLHGTDTMDVSAKFCFEQIGTPSVPVVFTGAMKPLGFMDTDAMQNVTEALLAAKLVAPGFYIAFHNRLFQVPRVRKNRDKRTFETF